MSLISDALKKARQDVARQDALRPRTPYAVGAAEPARRQVPYLPLLAGLGAGCLVAGLLLAFAWSAGWGPFGGTAKTDVEVAEAAPPAAPAPAIPQAAAPAAPAVVPEPAPSAPLQAAPAHSPAPALQESSRIDADPPAAPPAPVPAPTPSAPMEEDSPPAAASPAPPAPAPVHPSAAPSAQNAGDLVDGQTYTGEVPVPGGGTVKLNGIAFSPDRPIAVLDGRVMAPGENIQGFTLVAIEAGRVKLQGFGATVFVSPK